MKPWIKVHSWCSINCCSLLHAVSAHIYTSKILQMIQAFVLCLINYGTWKNLWEVGPACDWAVDMNKCYPRVYLADSNRCLNRQYEHWVNDGNNIKYLHIAKAFWQQKRDCLCSKVGKPQCDIVHLSIGQLLINN